MWSTVGEVCPVFMPAPVGQTIVAEPQTSQREVTERFSVAKVTGVVAYENPRFISTLHWVAKCS
jgi:hypothetical protein